MKRRLTLFTTLVTLLLGATLASAQTQPANQAATAPAKLNITIAKDTTYLTDVTPRPDGTINYLAAYDAIISKGVTPDNNLLIPLLKILGPKGIPETKRSTLLARLNLKDLPLDGDYFESFADYAKSTTAKDGKLDEQIRQFNDNNHPALSESWQESNYPELAAWLKKQAAHLDAAVRASDRPRFYIPPISDADESVISVSLPNLARCREIARALSLRANLRAADGKLDAALQDSFAVHRIAHAMSTGGSLIERLVGYACEAIAIRSDTVILSTGKLTAATAKAYMTDLKGLQPLGDVASSVDVSERFCAIDAIMQFARGNSEPVKDGLRLIMPEKDAPAFKITPDQAGRIDWDALLRRTNEQHDTIAVNFRRNSYTSRVGSQYEYELKLTADRKIAGAEAKNAPDDLNKNVSFLFRCVSPPSLWKAQVLYERALMLGDLDQLALALTAYHADHGNYPDALAPLVDANYLKEIPLDRFIDKPLHYTRSNSGFLLYSVSDDLKDDGGDPGVSNGNPDLVINVGK